MKNKYKSIVFVNQTIGPLFLEVISNFTKIYPEIIVISGKSSTSDCRSEGIIRFDNIINYNKSNNIKRIFTWIFGTLQILVKIIFKYRASDLFIVSNPPFSFLITLLCKNNYSLLVYDIYPDILSQAGIIKENSFINKWWERKNIVIYRKAKNIYTISEGMASYMTKYIERSKINVIPNWFNVLNDNPRNKEDNEFIKKYSLQNKFLILYSGNIGNTHNLNPLIEVANLLKNEKDIVFIVCGEGAKKKEMEKIIIQKQINNFLLLPFQPENMFVDSLKAADIGVVTLDLNFSELSVPSKTYNLMAHGVSLLCISNKSSELASIIRKYCLGEVYEPRQIFEIADYILRMRNNPAILLKYK